MYNYEWDLETGGYILTSKLTGVTKEVRPVFWEEIRTLGFEEEYGWHIPETDLPIMWSEGRRYIYRGETVGEASGGGLYLKPTLKNVVPNLAIEPVNMDLMLKKNANILEGLVQKTLKDIYDIYEQYKNKVDMFYAAFSGGKDSVVMLDLVQRALPHDSFEVVFGDTTMELSDTYRNVEQSKKLWWDLSWHTAKTDFNAEESWRFVGPPASNIRWCCGVHKSAPSVMKIKSILAQKRECDISAIKHFKVLAFLGVRAEESYTRSQYSMLSDGNKHAVQMNCNPILKWSSGEVFLYILSNKLPLNYAYRVGSHRVGCLMCPMSTEWYEYILQQNYNQEVTPYIDIIKSMIDKNYNNDSEWEKYLRAGGWKRRSSGKLLKNPENKLLIVDNKNEERIIIKNPNYSWKKWMPALGDFVEIDEDYYSIQYKDIVLKFKVIHENENVIFSFSVPNKSKSSIRFMYLFKNALVKSAYCKNCKECMAECLNGALTITKDDIIIKNCLHCERCLSIPKGCIVAKSLISTGDSSVKTKNIDRYKNFGFRQEWIEIYFEDIENFWSNDRMGKMMFKSFERWGKESGLLAEKNAPVEYIDKLNSLGADSITLWGYLYTNIVYNSSIFNWYIRNTEINTTYQVADLMLMIGEDYSPTTIKNAFTSLKSTMKDSPIGTQLGQGACEMKGRVVTSLTRHAWNEPDPVVILYSLYMFAENSDGGIYSFTLSELAQDFDEREALSPNLIFGLDNETLKPILQGLAHDFPDFITVDFNKGFMENVYLVREKKSSDVVMLM